MSITSDIAPLPAPRSYQGSFEPHVLRAARTVTLDAPVHCCTIDAVERDIDPGSYVVDATPTGHLILSSVYDDRVWTIAAARDWHEIRLLAPLALALEEHEAVGCLALLMPDGVAYHAAVGREPSGVAAFTSEAVAKEVLKKGAQQSLKGVLPSTRGLLFSPAFVAPHLQPYQPSPFAPPVITLPAALRPAIEPRLTPTIFAPLPYPHANWIGGWVISAPQGGGYIPNFPFTRDHVNWVVSTTPVTIKSPMSLTGVKLTLYVTNHVAGHVSYMDQLVPVTVVDIYELISQSAGPVSFPDVVVANGRRVTGSKVSPAEPITLHKYFTAGGGAGAPVDFELDLNGVSVASRNFQYKGNYPGSPALVPV